MTNSSTLRTPGQLLANIPGILGFYPSDSIVLMAFEENNGDLALGPTLRFDISDLSSTLADALTAVDYHRCVFIMPFAITTSQDADLLSIAGEIFHHASLLDVPITAMWHTTEIADGEPFAIIERDLDAAQLELIGSTEDLPESWKSGYIDKVVNSATMEPFIKEGRLPGYDRDEAHAPLHVRNHIIDADTLDLTQGQALHAAAIMHEKNSLAIPRYGYGLEDLLNECEELISQAASYGFDAADSCLHDIGILGVAAMTMGNTYVRDLTAATYLDHPEETAAIMLATSQSFIGVIRNNALCIYAAAQIKRGMPMYAGMALGASQSADRQHSLTSLMLQCYLNGLAKNCVDNIYQGSANARSHHYRKRAEAQEDPEGSARAGREKSSGADTPDFDDAA
ncbi:DUF4192 domain-containing protein [Corynebacterium ammoniagenes]|uniref:DUF4192 domain-containing protein n=1 Tax=Corynebacterium ammoniagenes TaxID=1697 RepID=A0AAV5G7R7_CORAM|nr:DUF4192 domain-containing protein [Corynebacterium ammoniagenes]GJN42325.1 hypothetical protein CAT723_08040 [Corynebacterium ammoniagenes]